MRFAKKIRLPARWNCHGFSDLQPALSK